MKSILVLVVFIFAVVNTYGQQLSTSATTDFKKLSWLEGGWNRTNTKPNRTTKEYWKKSGATSFQGKGVNLSGSDTVFVEKLKIVVKNDTLYYVADIPENKGEVFFRFTSLSATGFACENPSHDFPKRIEYKLDGEKLKATISGDGKSIDYWFERIR